MSIDLYHLGARPSFVRRKHRGRRSDQTAMGRQTSDQSVRIVAFRVADGPAVEKCVSGVIAYFDVRAAGITLAGCKLRRRRNLDLIVVEPASAARVFAIDDAGLRQEILQAACRAAEFFGCHVGLTPCAP